MILHWWMVPFALLVVLTSAGCGQEEEQPWIKEVTYRGTITEVRIAFILKRGDAGSSGIGGAIVGGLVAGAPGAVVGYALSTEPPTAEQIVVSCLYMARIGDDEVEVLDESPNRCALRRRGDVVTVINTMYQRGQLKGQVVVRVDGHRAQWKVR